LFPLPGGRGKACLIIVKIVADGDKGVKIEEEGMALLRRSISAVFHQYYCPSSRIRRSFPSACPVN